MDEWELFGSILSSEDDAIAFLKTFGLYTATSIPCKGKKGVYCDGTMYIGPRKIAKGRSAKYYICARKKCHTSITIRKTNNFFCQFDKNGKASNKMAIVQIIHFVYRWIHDGSTVKNMMIKTSLQKNTILKWSSRCRAVCSKALSRRPMYEGSPNAPVQIDEAYFSGRRKYNRGRLRKGDIKPKGEKEAQAEEDCARVTSKRNYGNRVIGPWVFGIYWSRNCVRFIVIPDRKGTTLIPLIKKFVVPNSVVVSDEWSGYSRLEENGYVHETVCHKRSFVNPDTGYHTQGIERAWIEGKAVIKRARYPTINLQAHLDEVSWRMLYRGYPGGLFRAFLRDAREGI